ncbi:MAG: zinc/manganese transport system substrate-binding protein [Rhodospirillaceae bacterium]|nr:zinc/manganese transport system substrate-binding protein [Rhodospirillaceae bacterium]
MMMFGRLLLAAALSFAALPASAQTKPKVVATFSILGDLVAQVAGDRIDLAVLVGADTDAHTYQPKPTDARTLAAAQAMVSNGLGFEGWIDRLAEAAPFKGRPVVATAGVPALEATSPGYSHTHGPDPHCWQDVGRARRYVANIATGLVEADPANAAYYREHARSYDQRLADLDQWIKAEIAKVPTGQRKAITGHDSFRYFAQAYGVQFQAPRGYNTNSEPSARDVAALIRLVREQKIKALFVENMTNPGLVDQIARESGAVVGPRLYSDALSAPSGPAPTYEAMMRHNVTALVAGMLKN